MNPVLFMQAGRVHAHAPGRQPAIDELSAAAAALGFDGFAAVAWIPAPAAMPTTCMLSDLPDKWLARYRSDDGAAQDPAVLWCKTRTSPLVWSDEAVRHGPTLTQDITQPVARHGWSIAVQDALGVPGMFSLVRTSGPIGREEQASKQLAWRVLAHRAHRTLLASWRAQKNHAAEDALTSREVEVLRWAADGKTALDTAIILDIKLSTVRFHINNAVRKLGAANIAAAVFRALVLGQLHGLPDRYVDMDSGHPS